MEVWHLLFIQYYIIFTLVAVIKKKLFREDHDKYTIPVTLIWAVSSIMMILVLGYLIEYTLTRPSITEVLRYKLY